MTLYKCIIINQHVYKSERSVCVVAVVCTLCNCVCVLFVIVRVSISKHTNGGYSSAEHCLILWLDYKTKWCQVYSSSVSHSCNNQWHNEALFSIVHYCDLLDNDWDYNTFDYSDNLYYIAVMLPLQPFWEPRPWWGLCCSFEMLARVQRASNTIHMW